MKEFTLKTIKEDGTLVGESTLKVDTEKFLLIQRVPENATAEYALLFHRKLQEAIEGAGSLITIPEGIKLEVLEIK